MLSECSQPFDQSFPGEVPILEHRFESLRCYGFHSYERSLDIGFAHGIQIFTILTCLHGDLGEKHHVLRQSGKFLHQLETFCANRLELLEFGQIVLLACETKVGQAYGVKNTMSFGSLASSFISSKRSARIDSSSSSLAKLFCWRARRRSVRLTG